MSDLISLKKVSFNSCTCYVYCCPDLDDSITQTAFRTAFGNHSRAALLLLPLLLQAVSARLDKSKDAITHQLQLLRLLLPDLDESISEKRTAVKHWTTVGDHVMAIRPGPRGGNVATLDLGQEESQIMQTVQVAIRYVSQLSTL